MNTHSNRDIWPVKNISVYIYIHKILNIKTYARARALWSSGNAVKAEICAGSQLSEAVFDGSTFTEAVFGTLRRHYTTLYVATPLNCSYFPTAITGQFEYCLNLYHSSRKF